MLADRGHLEYEQKVTDLWPEYAQKGKGETTIAMVMRHEAGLASFKEPLPAVDLVASRIREGAVSDIIARQPPSHTPGAKREYHSVSRGFIVNEIVRRADPSGRTIGEFIRDEIAAPLELQSELAVGVPDAMQGKIAPLTGRLQGQLMWTWYQLLMPRMLGGGKIPLESNVMRVLMLAGLPVFSLYRTLFSSSPSSSSSANSSSNGDVDGGDSDDKNKKKRSRGMGELSISDETRKTAAAGGLYGVFNSPEVRRAEIPSANGHASARALATVASAMVNGGTATTTSSSGDVQVQLLTPQGVASAHGNPVKKTLFGVMDTRFTNAGWNKFVSGNRDGYVGWMGLGGSVCQWHPRLSIGFGYAPNAMELTPTNERGSVMQRLVVECATQQQQVQGQQVQSSRL